MDPILSPADRFAMNIFINRIFKDASGDQADLCRFVDAELSDPYLPKWYVVNYCTIRAWSFENSKYYMREAIDVLAQMREIKKTHGASKEQIASFFAELVDLIRRVDASLAEIPDVDYDTLLENLDVGTLEEINPLPVGSSQPDQHVDHSEIQATTAGGPVQPVAEPADNQ